MASADLIAALLDIEESGWDQYRGASDNQAARKLTQGEMARLLRPFGIRPRSIWPQGKRRRGEPVGKAITAPNLKALGNATARQPAQRHKPAISGLSAIVEAAQLCRCAALPLNSWCCHVQEPKQSGANWVPIRR